MKKPFKVSKKSLLVGVIFLCVFCLMFAITLYRIDKKIENLQEQFTDVTGGIAIINHKIYRLEIENQVTKDSFLFVEDRLNQVDKYAQDLDKKIIYLRYYTDKQLEGKK